MYLPVQPERLYERIINQIEGRIVAGELKAGDQLPSENELAKQFAVSRTAVREAIKALREKPLVEVRWNKYAVIQKPQPPTRNEAFNYEFSLYRMALFKHKGLY